MPLLPTGTWECEYSRASITTGSWGIFVETHHVSPRQRPLLGMAETRKLRKRVSLASLTHSRGEATSVTCHKIPTAAIAVAQKRTSPKALWRVSFEEHGSHRGRKVLKTLASILEIGLATRLHVGPQNTLGPSWWDQSRKLWVCRPPGAKLICTPLRSTTTSGREWNIYDGIGLAPTGKQAVLPSTSRRGPRAESIPLLPYCEDRWCPRSGSWPQWCEAAARCHTMSRTIRWKPVLLRRFGPGLRWWGTECRVGAVWAQRHFQAEAGLHCGIAAISLWGRGARRTRQTRLFGRKLLDFER